MANYDIAEKTGGGDLSCFLFFLVICRRPSIIRWFILKHEEIIFIDENNGFLPTDEFAKAVQESDNYYVIVTREGLPNLAYSVEEIYGIRESGKYGTLKQTYNELYHIYGKRDYIYDTRQLSKIYEAQDK